MSAQAVRSVLAFFAVILAYTQSYLVLTHIEGTELMWFIYWLSLPFAIMLTALGILADNERIDKRVGELLGRDK